MTGISSSRLKDKKEKILSLWEERCLKEVASAGTVTSLALRDSLPSYLDHLSECLATNSRMDFRSIHARDAEATRVGKKHGTDRAESKSYELTEVIFEYHILREVLFQVLENEGPLDPIQRDITLDSLEQAVNDAAVEFSEIHTDVQQKFVDTLTHDLKNPITSAKMNADLILRRTDLPVPVITSAKRINGSLNRLTSMIHDLLDASKVRAGEELSLNFEKCDLDGMIREVVEDMEITYGDRFIFDSNEAIEGHWGCDGLRRAIENLIVNAVKYSTPQTPITISLHRQKTGVEVSVHNRGPVISEVEIPLLFQRFRRSKSAHEGNKTGWGLGLTLVKGVVDAHKGKVRVESNEKTGTSFILEIPFGAAKQHLKDEGSSSGSSIELPQADPKRDERGSEESVHQ